MIKTDFCNFVLLIFLASLFLHAKSSNPDSPTFSVGVIEFSRDTSDKNTIYDKLNTNLNGYKNLLKQYIDNQIGKDIDLVIFPEATLNHYETAIYIPEANPYNETGLCQKFISDPDLLTKLACWAGQFRRYISYNVIEKVDCVATNEMPCGDDRLTRYNTNIVFDRNGALIAKYRKWNLYKEFMINKTQTPDIITFNTDFGVQFGIFICFDIIFWTPPQELIRRGVKHFIYPTMWYSQLPFLTANQYQQSWAYANNVTLFVSGASDPLVGSTGSGVFNGRNGAIFSEMQSKPTKKMFIMKILKDSTKVQPNLQQQTPRQNVNSPYPIRLPGLFVKRNKDVSNYANILLNATNLNLINETLCYDNFCCRFTIKRVSFNNQQITNSYSYRLIAYSGNYIYSNLSPSWYKVCAIIACTDNKSLDSCGQIFNDNESYMNNYYFDRIEINGEFNNQEKLLIMPSTVDASFAPLSVDKFDLNLNDGHDGATKKAVMTLKAPEANLLTFGIYANYFDNSFNGTPRNSFNLIVLIFGLIVIRFFRNMK